MKNLPVGTQLKLNAKGASQGTMGGFFAGDIVTIIPNRFGLSDSDYKVENESGTKGYLDKLRGGYSVVEVEGTAALLEKLEAVEKELAEIKALLAKGDVPSFSSIVQRAQDDVATIEATLSDGNDKDDGNNRYRHFRNIVEFHVNHKKGVVTALLRGKYSNAVFERGFAHCHPNDTFNEHIGKAIALRRACGLEVPKEYLGGK